MKRLLKEPLIHFLVLGTLLFAVAHLFGDNTAPREDRIVISEGKIEHLATIFMRTWQRPPTHHELDVLVRDFIQEEVAYREGMAMGLDYDDTIIRRRIRQKLEFIAEDLVRPGQPTTEELDVFFSEHREDYRVAPVVSFQQVCITTKDTDRAAEEGVQVVLAALNTDPAAARDLGDETLLEPRYENLPLRDVRTLFGSEFADAILEVQPGQWQGPLRSAYGQHLVRIDRIVEGRLPALEEVRDMVQRDLDSVRRRDGLKRFYEDLTEKYDVVVEWPEPSGQAQSP